MIRVPSVASSLRLGEEPRPPEPRRSRGLLVSLRLGDLSAFALKSDDVAPDAGSGEVAKEPPSRNGQAACTIYNVKALQRLTACRQLEVEAGRAPRLLVVRSTARSGNSYASNPSSLATISQPR